MPVYTDLSALPGFRNAAVTIGVYDGVHLGHRAILQQVVEEAKSVAGDPVLITFHPHPRSVLQPGEPVRVLTTLEERLRLVQEAGIRHSVVVPFSAAFAEMSAEAYVQNFLVRHFHPAVVVVGYDHRFGRGREGGIHTLEALSATHNYRVAEVPARLIQEAAVSSTKIRRAVEGGWVEEAAAMLGRPYAVTGTVVRGRQLGLTLGYPTANIQPNDASQLIPAVGVYAVRVVVEGRAHDAMLSVGNNPTIAEGLAQTIEANLFDFSGDLYGVEVTVEFVAWLRGEEKFASLEALKAQLALDAVQATKALQLIN